MYIPKINWDFSLCIVVVLYFKESENGSCHGLSITVTGAYYYLATIFLPYQKRVNKLLIFLFLGIYGTIELGFFSANVIKFSRGRLDYGSSCFIGICMHAWYNGRMDKKQIYKICKTRELYFYD